MPVACNFLLHANIPCTFYSTHYTMPNFSIPSWCTSTSRAPLIKLLGDKHILTLRSHQQKSSALYQFFTHYECHYYACAHHARQYYACATQSAPHNDKFSAQTHTPIFSVHYYSAPHNTKFRCAHPRAIIFSHYHSSPHNAKFKCAHPHNVIFFAIPLCTAQHKFKCAHLCTNIFHASQDFHCTSCIFSAHTYARSFLYASIPREFHCRNWGFCQNFSQFSP